MDVTDLRKLLKNSDDQLNIFKDRETLSKYKLYVPELIDLINDFLSNEQKAKLFEFEHFKKLSSNIRIRIIRAISDDNIKLKLLENSEIISEIANYQLMDIVDDMGDNVKFQIIRNTNFIKKHDFKVWDIMRLIKSLSNEKKRELLSDKELVQQGINLEEYNISTIISLLEDEHVKFEMIEFYKLKKYHIVDVFETFSDKSKINVVLENQYEFSEIELEGILSTLGVDSLIDFIKDNKEWLEQKGINTYKIIGRMNKESQLEFISKFEEIGLNLNEKRKILAKLSEETKGDIDTSNFPAEYVTAIEMKMCEDFSNINSYGKIKVEFDKDLEIYRGLDELIYINAMEVSEDEKLKLLKLCEICPKMCIEDEIGLCSSTVEEYKNSEIWIESVLQKIDKDWTDIQKVAFIDHAVGSQISYSPDFDTEVSDIHGARALWKIIHSGYGVCNGIAQVEKYILSKVGIEAEMVSGKEHAFLKLKNIEIPNQEGKVTIGDTILDPTWNLTTHRYGAKPENFCRSYAEIRKHDIRSDGTDTECHKNDEALENVTLELDEQSLRKIFTSIGLADKDGNFPIKNLIDKSKIIDGYNLTGEEAIKKQFLLLKEYYSEFAICQNSTSSILQGTLLNQEKFKFNRCVVNRVYERDDENKRPVLYVYVDFPESGKKFYLADSDTKQFLEVSQREFEARYECYEADLEKQDGRRPWEVFEKTDELEELNRSSGKVIASEGEER